MAGDPKDLLKPFRYPKTKRFDPHRLPEIYQILRKSFGHQRWWPGETPFEVIVGAILTQNTSWKNVEKAILNLKQAGKLSPKTLHQMPAHELAALIRPAGYFNVKAARLKSFLDFFFREYGGEISRMKKEKGSALREKLLAVKGIGPETADSILLYALDKPFFVIDAYTKRIFSRHGLYISDYHELQKVFLAHLPAKRGLFNDYHAQIVALAKDFCKASAPDCDRCPLHPYFAH